LVFIIKITDKQDGIRLATVAQNRSFKTLIKFFTQATKLEMDAADKDFNKVAKGMGLTVVQRFL
jgi:peptidyl-prolyl cis-trans isomerase D